MRFPRQAKIFRGTLDAAPVAGVFFLMVMFMLLCSMLYTPGVLLQTGAGQSLRVTRQGEIHFAGKSYLEKDWEQLRQDVKHSDPTLPLALEAEPGAPAKLVARAQELPRIEPPAAEHLSGTENPTVMVAVNLRGQLFYENQIVSEQELKAALRNSLKAAQREAKNLTLVLLEDGAVESKVSVRLRALAREVGIKEVLLAARPAAFISPSSEAAK